MATARVRTTVASLAFALVTPVAVLATAQPAAAHPLCDANPDHHTHYHFPYAHEDDWWWSFNTGTTYKHWWNSDHMYYESTGDCD
jgi:hypothetical protein